MKSKSRLILRIIIYVIISLIIGIQIYVINAKLIGGNPYPTPVGIGIGVITSGSMEPTYHVDDLIISKEQDSYQVGDNVVFQEQNSAVVHRIVKIDDSTFQTKGDANNTLDQPHPITDIKGKVFASLSGAGNMLNLIKSPVTSAVLIVILFVVIWRIGVKEKDEANKEQDELKKEIESLKNQLENKSVCKLENKLENRIDKKPEENKDI